MRAFAQANVSSISIRIKPSRSCTYWLNARTFPSHILIDICDSTNRTGEREREKKREKEKKKRKP